MAGDVFAVRGQLSVTQEIIDEALTVARATQSNSDTVLQRYRGLVTWVDSALRSANTTKRKIEDALGALSLLISVASAGGVPHPLLMEARGHLEAATTDAETLISNYMNLKNRLAEMEPLISQNDQMVPAIHLTIASATLQRWARSL